MDSKIGTDERLDRSAFPARTVLNRPYSVSPYRGRNDKCLRVVDDERFKRVRWTFHHGFFPLHEIQNIYSTLRLVGHRFREPVPAGFDEFPFVQPGSFLPPTVAGCDFSKLVDQVLLHPTSGSTPLNVRSPVLDVDWPGQTVESDPVPIPQFKGKDVRSCTDFEDHAVLP